MNVHTTEGKVLKNRYYAPKGGLPPQTARMDERAVFTNAYALLPASTMTDIVTSNLPFWVNTRLWVLSRPMSGFSETFSQYLMEVAPGGGSDKPELDENAEAVLFVLAGDLTLTIEGNTHDMTAGGYAFVPPATNWSVKNISSERVNFIWVRKHYDVVKGIELPTAFVVNERDIAPIAMPNTDGKWATTRFVEPDDIGHDMHVNIVTFEPGGVIPFPETHVMEHGIYVLEGKAAYKLNQDWVEVEAGDYMWLRAFCPQACYASGPGKFRYIIYKDVNRHARLVSPYGGP
ncbi:MAG: (S)-ureidoglycine aminohydrolase [Blastopirellula sp.]|nr:MAG: (S)-ureidoglycine aminohydrolase [Blastopirellula sp.]